MASIALSCGESAPDWLLLHASERGEPSALAVVRPVQRQKVAADALEVATCSDMSRGISSLGFIDDHREHAARHMLGMSGGPIYCGGKDFPGLRASIFLSKNMVEASAHVVMRTAPAAVLVLLP